MTKYLENEPLALAAKVIPCVAPSLADTTRIRSVAQIKRLLGKLISAFIRGEIAGDNAKTLCYLCTSFVAVARDTDLEKRLEEIESSLKKGVI